ncbi:uncharacterized protein BX663DRAFT_425069, partial [Cokeromyces recurvatus]|uniref:uncharacterized protein n=1 Tax=Cokeromyces recurvatus TaxID=90255 RepID=UPI00221F7AC3
KGFFIVMGNCRVHHTRFVVDAIVKQGYKPSFMPPYSPFFLKKIPSKSAGRRSKVVLEKTL